MSVEIQSCVLRINYAESYHWNVQAASLSYVSIYYISKARNETVQFLYIWYIQISSYKAGEPEWFVSHGDRRSGCHEIKRARISSSHREKHESYSRLFSVLIRRFAELIPRIYSRISFFEFTLRNGRSTESLILFPFVYILWSNWIWFLGFCTIIMAYRDSQKSSF